MEIKRLRYFRAIVEAGGVSRGAALLQVTPPTMSKAVRLLEEELGWTLFNRVGRGLELTDQGRALYSSSERLIEEYARLLTEVLETGRPAETFRFASFEPFTTHTLGALVDDTLADLSLTVVDLRPGDIERAVASREVDAGVTYAPRPHPELDFSALGRVEFGIYGRRSYAKTPFEQLPFAVPISTVSGGPLDRRTVDSWPAEKQRTVKYRLTNLESALELARGGRCVVFLPAFIAAHQNKTVKARHALTRLPIPRGMKAVRQTVHLVMRSGTASSPVVDAFAAAVRRAVRATIS